MFLFSHSSLLLLEITDKANDDEEFGEDSRLAGLTWDSVVVFTDADEMVSGDLLFQMKHCEVKTAAYPVQLTLKDLFANLRGGCSREIRTPARARTKVFSTGTIFCVIGAVPYWRQKCMGSHARSEPCVELA